MDVLILILRYLRTRRIAHVAVVCVAVAVCAMIVVTSVMDGFRTRIWLNIRSMEPDLAVRLKGDLPPRHLEAVEEELRSEMSEFGGPLANLAPRLVTKGIVRSEIDTVFGRRALPPRGVHVIGIDWEREEQVLPLDRVLGAVREDDLRVDAPENEDPLTWRPVPGILLGESLAAFLKTVAGDRRLLGRTNRVSLFSGHVAKAPTGDGLRLEHSNLDFRVSGAFESGRDDFDDTSVIVDRRHLYELRYGKDPGHPDCTRVHARLAPPYDENPEAVKAGLLRRHPRLEVETWEDRNRGLLDALNVEKRTMSLVLGFVVLVAVSLILGLLYMMVLEKTRDIGVLRSMGMSPGRIVLLFMGYGTALGLMGAALGVGLGMLVVHNLTPLTGWLADNLGLEIFSKNVAYRFRDIPAILSSSQVTWIAVLTVALSTVSGAVAAYKASTYDPVRCLRYE